MRGPADVPPLLEREMIPYIAHVADPASRRWRSAVVVAVGAVRLEGANDPGRVDVASAEHVIGRVRW